MSFLQSGKTNHTEGLLVGVRQQNSRLLSHRELGSSWSCSVDNNCPFTCTNEVIWPEKLLHGLKSTFFSLRRPTSQLCLDTQRLWCKKCIFKLTQGFFSSTGSLSFSSGHLLQRVSHIVSYSCGSGLGHMP